MEPQVNRNFQLIILIPAILAGMLLVAVAAGRQHLVRVAVLNEAMEFGLSVRGQYRMTDPKTGQELGGGRKFPQSDVSPADGGIKVGDTLYNTTRLRITGFKDASLYVNDAVKKYRGQIDIHRTKAGALLVINTVDLESYVRGVLYHEVSHRWPLNAIKAQAVATRTYALYQTKERARQLYDVTSDVYSQVYGGRSAERYRTNIAAGRTRGEVLLYEGKILPAYFHSSCGGHTENAAELWKHDNDFEPLSGLKCVFCLKGPHAQWKRNFRSKDIQDKLNQNGHSVGLIQEIRVVERNDSGRVKALKITGRDGRTETVTGTKFRQMLGPNVLKSSKYDIVMQGYYFDIIGQGWGHGVGMCQWGAYEMAKQRYDHTSILEFYYPGAKVGKIPE